MPRRPNFQLHPRPAAWGKPGPKRNPNAARRSHDRVGLRLPPELRERLELHAVVKRVSLTRLIIDTMDAAFPPILVPDDAK